MIVQPDGMTRRSWLQLAAGTSALALTYSFQEALGQVPSGASPTMFQNPLFAGDFADPTILRVGPDFYFTHTSYAYAPGLVVWHSRDLVNWLPISHAVDNTYGDGEIWAPDLAECNGHYYIYFPANGRLCVVHADHPRGPWSAPVDLKLGGIDPGHIVGPDGTRYLHFAGGHVVTLSADGLSVTGETQHVYDGWDFPKDWKTEGKWLESPKLTRRGEYYYMICAEGGTSGPATSHMSVVARSKSPVGPWENSPHNPLIHTYSSEETWWSVGHGSLISTPDDRWYFLYHSYRKNFTTLGRHVLLEPVEWTKDGWPVAPLGVARDKPFPSPMGAVVRPMVELSDDFRAAVLKPTWSAWKEKDMKRFQPSGGTLTVLAKGNSPAASSPLTIMARDESYQVEVAMAPKDPDSCGALGIFYNPGVWMFVEFKGGQLTVHSSKKEFATREWKEKTARIRIMNRSNRVEVLASRDGKDWQSVAADIDVSGFNNNDQHGFQSARPALAASGGGSVRFADFRYVKL